MWVYFRCSERSLTDTAKQTDILFFARLVSPQDPKSATNPPAYSEKILNNVLFNSLKGQTLTLHQVSLSSTVAELKQRLGREKSINMSELRLICCGKQWDESKFPTQRHGV
jgi:hypothetical protein